MLRRMIAPLLIGLIGASILVGLGVWQVQRLAWKTALLADIEARIAATPVALPLHPDPVADRYLPVTVSGTLSGTSIHVLSSRKGEGAGYRIVSALVTPEGRRILVDRGYVPEEDLAMVADSGHIDVVGNLHRPSEVDSFTPDPDLKANIWFARDVPAMARALKTEPVLVVARSVQGDNGAATPMPVDTSGIPNDHLNYAITWFSLALAWLGMTAHWLWRIRRRSM